MSGTDFIFYWSYATRLWLSKQPIKAPHTLKSLMYKEGLYPQKKNHLEQKNYEIMK